MIINNNISAVNAQRTLKFRNVDLSKDMASLASGMRINRAGDDASGLAVSEKMRTQIRGLRQAERNTQDGISFIQTTEGYLQESQDILQRIRELAVQSANGIYTDDDRMLIQVEVSQLVDEVNRIASQAQFNTLNMLTGRFADPNAGGAPAASMWFHMGANMDERRRVYIGTMTAAALGLQNTADGTTLSISSIDKANSAIGLVDEALMKVSKQRSNLGAYQNRLELTAQGLMIGYENTMASESRIRDTDMAEASVKFAKDQILSQTNLAMLAQANTMTQGVLRLVQ
ncbi:flagellin [Brachyspira pilosicoli]|nr:flagellin [Brachyspira pilosicoli]AGA66866.1 endoflagellar protein, FlaB2 [Brachyspira pilosicoli P43/6/78]MBW5377772.1 flagellin [Brachyspira pilosicoli]MBW5383124.1 flagellin [Brachyspira pilosicoli]MBW5392089.1 flagellin [Brachyspira pilosicoli]MBW5396529.1 flagellin [Brachyspira pilosicoli]